jgi:hypothetical protein
MLMYVLNAKVYYNITSSKSARKSVIVKEFFGGLSHYLVKRENKARILIGVDSFRLLIEEMVFSACALCIDRSTHIHSNSEHDSLQYEYSSYKANTIDQFLV